MSNAVLLVLFLFTAAVLIERAELLKCYKCDSCCNDDCVEEGFKNDKFTQAECEALEGAADNAPTCYKMIVQDSQCPSKSVYRMGFTSAQACEKLKAKLAIKECLKCTQDGCNAAPVVGAVTFLYAPLALIRSLLM